MLKVITVFLPIFLMFASASPAPCEDNDLAGLFADREVAGTIVLSELVGSKRYVFNERRANTTFVPASTFKILNTLIALETGAVSENDIIKWDGKDKGLAVWNRDQTLESAFNSS